MNRFYKPALCLSVAFVLAPWSQARADDDKGKPTKQRRPHELIARVLHLMPPDYAFELDLTAEQHKSLAALEGEFRKKRQEILMQSVMKVWSMVDGLDDEGDKREPAPVLAIAHEVTGGLLNLRRSRASFEHKLLAMLNPEQREHFAALKEHGLRDRHGDRHAAVFFQALPRDTERRLNLTPEQQRKLTEMRQEWRKQFETVLTPEQRQQLERLSAPRRSRDRDAVEQND
jgi:Spy/CpxP family protein refolding chaperone